MRVRRIAAAVLAAALTACNAAAEDIASARHVALLDPGVTNADLRMPLMKPLYTIPKLPPRRSLFDGSRHVLPDHRVVAIYGAAGTPALGVLGTGTPEQTWPRLRRQAKEYETRRTPVLPAYELIAFVATGSRGNQGNFSSRVADRTIGRFARAARRHHALLILDIQPGRGRFLPDARSLKRWLRLPFVSLALDPEWKLYGNQLPLSRIGHTNGRTINRVSRWLNRLTRENGLPQKLLLVHEFTDDMVRHKGAIVARKHLALTFNVDGFGSRAAKLGKYADFATDKRFPLGFKLFYDWDIGLMSPRAVLRMRPRPSVVEYQ